MPEKTPDNGTTVRAALRFALAHPEEFAKWVEGAVQYDAPELLQQAEKLLDPNEHWTVYYP
jgi:hypothetical protein